MSYAQHRYLLMTLDPTHIGAGGYRLGRVDNSIIREPGTGLPKIPGTSLSGAIRSYAAHRHGKIRCAGQGQAGKDDAGKPIPDTEHCGKDDCPICYTFGFTVGDNSRAGTVNIFDAHIALFPVSSMIGPVWVSTVRRLKEDFGFEVTGGEPDERPGSESFVTTAAQQGTPLNLGWLMLPVTDQNVTVTPPASSNWDGETEWKSIANRIVLAPETIFSQIVNANLEVRTSVSINPDTGAAQTGALFTYEAIPRGALLVFDVIQDDYRRRAKPWTGTDWKEPSDVVQAGLEWASVLGVGGMGTRGFGRFKLVGRRLEVSRG